MTKQVWWLDQQVAARKKRLPTRAEAISELLKKGVKPGVSMPWKTFGASVRTACRPSARERGFSLRSIQREVERQLATL